MSPYGVGSNDPTHKNKYVDVYVMPAMSSDSGKERKGIGDLW